MSPRPKSVQEYAALLGVSPKASREEISLAFALKKHEGRTGGGPSERELRDAFQALTNPEVRARLEQGGRAAAPNSLRSAAPMARARVSTPFLLVALLGVLAGAVGFFVWPIYGHHLRSFQAHDRLVETRTGKPYGTVLEVSDHHTFRNGRKGPAYRLRLAENGAEEWLPATDVKFLCVRE
jgi:curved DNA-binding protein CbpA